MSYIFLRFPEFRDKALTLSYDDGSIYDRKLIEIMNKYGLKGTFNLNSGFFPEKENGFHLTKSEAVALYKNSGQEVALHGAKHMSLAEVDGALATNDVLSDRKCLEETFGVPVQGMAYANGSYNDHVVEILKNCGVRYARTIESTERFDIPSDWLRLPATCHHNHPDLMGLAKKFLEGPSSYYRSRQPKLFYLWGHSFEFNNNDNWQVIEEFAAYVGGRNDVWYATNGGICDYVEAYDRLRFGANGDFVYNPSAISVYVNYFDKQYIVPAGRTIKLEQ